MYIEKYNRNELGNSFKRCKNQEILEEFQNSEYDCVKVKAWNHNSAYACTTSLNMSIKRYKIMNIRAITRKGEVFLIKE